MRQWHSNGNGGFNLLEAMVAVASTSILLLAFLEITRWRGSLLMRVKFSQVLSEIVIGNITEVKTRDLTLVGGDCLVRRYDALGVFIDERKTSVTNAACGNSELPPKTIEVYWKVTGASSIDATFQPAGFLKLPVHKASVLQIEVKGRAHSLPPGPPEQTLNAVIYRR